MRTAGVAELKAKLSEHLDRVKRGEEVLITERGQPIAKLVPIDLGSWDERMQRLASQGLVKLPEKKMTPEDLERILAMPRPHDDELLAFVLAELHKDRGER
ncbi:MAG TPA: type II toxin-antitoxin system prevent-host-death family antitoxin [Thermoanaerobaculia bacterium]